MKEDDIKVTITIEICHSDANDILCPGEKLIEKVRLENRRACEGALAVIGVDPQRSVLSRKGAQIICAAIRPCNHIQVPIIVYVCHVEG